MDTGANVEVNFSTKFSLESAKMALANGLSMASTVLRS